MFEIRRPTIGIPVRRDELGRHRLAHELRQRVGRLRPRLDRLVDGCEGRGRVERQPEDGLARRPDDPLEVVRLGGGEHVVGGQRVDPEGLRGRPDPGGRDRREVHDRVAARQRLHRLPVVREVREQRVAVVRAVAAVVDVEHVVPVEQQVLDDPAPRLTRPARDRDPHLDPPRVDCGPPGRGRHAVAGWRRLEQLRSAAFDGRAPTTAEGPFRRRWRQSFPSCLRRHSLGLTAAPRQGIRNVTWTVIVTSVEPGRTGVSALSPAPAAYAVARSVPDRRGDGLGDRGDAGDRDAEPRRERVGLRLRVLDGRVARLGLGRRPVLDVEADAVDLGRARLDRVVDDVADLGEVADRDRDGVLELVATDPRLGVGRVVVHRAERDVGGGDVLVGDAEVLERGDDPGHLLRGGVAGGLGGVALDADAEAHRGHVRDDRDLAFAAHRDGVLGRGSVRGGPGDRRLVGAVQERADDQADQERAGGDRGGRAPGGGGSEGAHRFRASLGISPGARRVSRRPDAGGPVPVARRCRGARGRRPRRDLVPPSGSTVPPWDDSPARRGRDRAEPRVTRNVGFAWRDPVPRRDG